VEVNANISAVLHPGIVLDYMIVDKQSKQVVQAPNKHPTRNTMAILSKAAQSNYEKLISSTNSRLTDMDDGSSQETTNTIPSSPSPNNNLPPPPITVGNKRPFSDHNEQNPVVVMPQTFRMAPPPPPPMQISASPILPAVQITLTPPNQTVTNDKPSFMRPGILHLQFVSRHFTASDQTRAGCKPLFCSEAMYLERQRKKMLLAEQNSVFSSAAQLMSSFGSTNNSDEIVLLSGNTTVNASNQSNELVRCFVPVQNMLKSNPPTPQCSMDDIRVIASSSEKDVIDTLVGMSK
jgi:hypothetical protein